jgi:AraC-like DNA-binding protein
MAPRRLYDHEFVYVMQGRGHIVVNGVSHPAVTDALFLIQPRQWHAFRADSGHDWLLLGVHFDWIPRHDSEQFPRFKAATEPVEESLFRESRRLRDWPSEERPFLELQGRPRVRRGLEDVVAEYGRADAEARAAAGALLAAVIGQIEREVRLLQELHSNREVGPDAVRRVQRARELLESPREQPLSIQEVAAAVGWSADHLRRICRAVLQVTPHEIQSAARVRRAQELLSYGGLSIREIAIRCGFEDASHFSRVFKKSTGFVPRDWPASRAGTYR